MVYLFYVRFGYCVGGDFCVNIVMFNWFYLKVVYVNCYGVVVVSIIVNFDVYYYFVVYGFECDFSLYFCCWVVVDVGFFVIDFNGYCLWFVKSVIFLDRVVVLFD